VSAGVASASTAARLGRRRRGLIGWAFMLPLVVVNAFVVLGPSLAAVYFSLTDWSGIGRAHWVGLDNYLELVGDPDFGTALWHNILWTAFFLVVPMAMGLFGAFALTRIRRGRLLLRVVYFVPYIVASVVTSAIWKNLLSPDLGIGRMLHVNVLGNIHLALPAVEIVNNWAWWGFLVVVFLAAMRDVNPNLYEAAALDGAGTFSQFWHVTLPSIRPTFLFLGLMTIIWSFLSFDYVYVLTQGGPAGSTDLLSTLLYRDAFGELRAGYASAIGVVMALISAVVVIGYLAVRKRKDWTV
jgi:raffinose/stachyose/melibiose transport system permease protein